MRIAILLTAVLVAAGCVSVPDDIEGASTSLAPASPWEGDPFNGLGDPLIVDHDHADLAAHALVAPSVSLLGYEGFRGARPPTLAFGEADLLGDSHVVVAGFAGTGFWIADVSDPAAPAYVSWTPEPGIITDVKASKSGNFVFVGMQLAPYHGVKAYYVGVPERPVPAGFFPVVGSPGGCHMLAVHNDHLYCAPSDGTVRIFAIQETAAAVALVPVAVYAPNGGEPAAPILGGDDAGSEFTHDMTVQDDPLTGAPVMYVSFWDFGLRVVDVSDPSSPTEIGAWLGEGAEEWGTYEGAIHTAMAGLVDGRRVIVVVPEYASVPSVTFLDATDYAAMRAVGVWAPKSAEALGDQQSTFSTHNFQFLEGKVYLAMYHGGVWVLDASTSEKLTRPLPVGYALLTGDGPLLAPTTTSVWDVLVKDGVILATGMSTGLHALQHEGDIGKVGLTSFA